VRLILLTRGPEEPIPSEVEILTGRVEGLSNEMDLAFDDMHGQYKA
jgi:hypothetical protein